MSGRAISPPPQIEDQFLQKWLSELREGYMQMNGQLANQNQLDRVAFIQDLVDNELLREDLAQNNKLYNPNGTSAPGFKGSQSSNPGTSNPSGQSPKLTVVTVDTTLTNAFSTVLVDASGGNVTVTLPLSLDSSDWLYTIKVIDNTNDVFIATTGGDKLDKVDRSVTPWKIVDLESIPVQADGSTGWWTL